MSRPTRASRPSNTYLSTYTRAMITHLWL
uniref:Uncharacterized protein n=1 Tax=Arundo donax TaxID=35708 RepID=A0A0A8YT35_ARUDO